MILQSISLGCAILLMIFGTTSSIPRFVVLNSGVLPVNQGDVAMEFYATVQNTGVETQTVQLNMKRCCLAMVDDSVDCKAMKLQKGFSVRVHPKKTFNLTAYFINKNLFGRNGECELKLMSTSTKEPVAEFKVQFNTTSSNPNFFQSIYRTMIGNYNNGNANKCDTSDQDCQSSECVLDYSGSRSFYDRKKKTCTSTPTCSNEKQKMLSPATNLCRDQYPSSFVVKSLTQEMKEGINDTDVVLQKVNPVEAVKVICVNGKMEADGHCKCDENWLSVKFEPQKLDPEKTPYYMCNVRSPQGEISDRTLSTGYAYTVLIVLVVILFPCCTGVGIMGIYLYQRNQKRKKKSFVELSKDLASGKSHADNSEDVISEIVSRREVRKSSTSRRSSNGQEPTTSSHCFAKDSENNSNHQDPPSPHDSSHSSRDSPHSPHDSPHSPHDPSPSPHDPPPSPHGSNINQANSTHNPAPSQHGSKVNPSNTASTKHFVRNDPLHFDAHHHPTIPSHHVLTRQPTRRQLYDNYFQGFQGVPVDNQEFRENSDDYTNNAFRSRSAPVMNMSYAAPELIAVPSNSENSAKAYFSTSQTLTPIPEHNVSNLHVPDDYPPFDFHENASDIDIRASVKIKQELWSKFLQNYNDSIRQHPEFGIQETGHSGPQIYQARSLPIMYSANNTSQRNTSYIPEEMQNKLVDTRSYTVFKPGQKSTTSISPTTPTGMRQYPQSFSVPSNVDIDEVEKMLLAAMKSKERTYIAQEDRIGMAQELFNPNRTTSEGLAGQDYPSFLKKDLHVPDLERLDSFVLLKRLSQENNSPESTPLEYSSSDNSDILIGSPMGGNKFWLQQLSSMESNDILKSQRVDSMILVEQIPPKNNPEISHALEPSSSDTSDILIGSPIGKNKFWIQKFTGYGGDPNETANGNLEKETNPYQIRAALKEQLRPSAYNSNDSSNKDFNPDIWADSSRSEDSNIPLENLAGDESNEQNFTTPQPPLTAEGVNSTFR